MGKEVGIEYVAGETKNTAIYREKRVEKSCSKSKGK